MFVPLYFGLVALGNGVEPFFSARKTDVLPIDEPSKLPDFHRLLTKSLNFATVMETLLNITLPICALAWLIKEIRLLIAEVKGRR